MATRSPGHHEDRERAPSKFGSPSAQASKIEAKVVKLERANEACRLAQAAAYAFNEVSEALLVFKSQVGEGRVLGCASNRAGRPRVRRRK